MTLILRFRQGSVEDRFRSVQYRFRSVQYRCSFVVCPTPSQTRVRLPTRNHPDFQRCPIPNLCPWSVGENRRGGSQRGSVWSSKNGFRVDLQKTTSKCLIGETKGEVSLSRPEYSERFRHIVRRAPSSSLGWSQHPPIGGGTSLYRQLLGHKWCIGDSKVPGARSRT